MFAVLRWLIPALAPISARPILEIVERLVGDRNLREQIKAEITGKIIDHHTALIDRGADVVIAEAGAESWLTHNWRPMLMLVLMGFLLFFGILLPCGEMIAGRRLMFEPRFDVIPDAAWNLLNVGLGGYIGGRSLEKIAASLAGERSTESARSVNVNVGAAGKRQAPARRN